MGPDDFKQIKRKEKVEEVKVGDIKEKIEETVEKEESTDGENASVKILAGKFEAMNPDLPKETEDNSPDYTYRGETASVLDQNTL